MIRFLHTSDWQLGMIRHFLAEGAQECYNQARFDAIRTLGRIATEEKCQFMAVCGDVFESNQVARKTVLRAIEALKEVKVPVYILPGNHDPLNEASVYSSDVFVQGKPGHVKVIDNPIPIVVAEDTELVGTPWLSKRVSPNPFDDVVTTLDPVRGSTRIVLSHGVVDSFAPKQADPSVLAADNLEQAIKDKKASFIALGDRHSLTRVGASERIWYSGTPEATDFGEPMAGYAHIVELDGDDVVTKPVRVGQWRFMEKDPLHINRDEDIEALKKMLDGLDHKEQTVIKLNLVGSVSLSQEVALRQSLDAVGQVFASLQLVDTHLSVLPDDADFSSLGFSGFAGTTIARLREKMAKGGGEMEAARDALMLIVRLGRGRA